MINSTIWSLTCTGNSPPAGFQLQSISTHAPVYSVAVTLLPPSTARRQLLQADRASCTPSRNAPVQQQSLQKLLPQLAAQYQQVQDVAWQKLIQADTDGSNTQQPQQQAGCDNAEVCNTQQWFVAPPHQLTPLIGRFPLEAQQPPQWQVVQCSAQQQQLQVDSKVQQNTNEQAKAGSARPASAAPQPEPLYRLVAAAKRGQPVDHQAVQLLLDELQPLLLQLAPDHLAHAAWAASQLAVYCEPHQQWLQLLLQAAERFFLPTSNRDCRCGSDGASSTDSNGTSMSATSVATFLQSLVKLQHRPSQEWLTACCNSMLLEHWTCPRALSTMAACLPQLGYAPCSSWAQQYFATTVANMHAFPPISLARMLHGVVAWQYVQRQQLEADHESVRHEQLTIPDWWLTNVLHRVEANSSRLKPPEIAMVLQSLQRLQQQPQQQQLQHDRLSPVADEQPRTALQQAGRQLLHSLMPAILQRLQQFGAKDLTVTMMAVAGLHSQQDQQQQDLMCPVVSWAWLQRVLRGVEARLPDLDPRGQAACLAAAAALIKPHLQHQLQQQQQQRLATASVAQEPQQQQHQPSSGVSSAVRPTLVKPLQRWLQQQQQTTQSLVHTPALMQPTSTPAAASSSTAAWPSSTFADMVGRWQSLLACFYGCSSKQLLVFSPEDLTVTACSLASMQEVPPVSWYELLLNAVQQQLPHMTSGQVAGIAAALGCMAMLPSQHNAGVSLVPSTAWMQRLYPAPPAATASQSEAADAVTTTHQTEQSDMQLQATVAARAAEHIGCCTYSLSSCSPAEVVRLLWAAGVCDFDPGQAWWLAAEQRLLAMARATATASRLEVHGSSNFATACVASGASIVDSQQLPAHFLGALLRAYAAAQRSVPSDILQHVVLAPGSIQQLLQGPIINTLRLLRGLTEARCGLPMPWLQQLAMQLQPQLAQLGPSELPQLLACLANAGLRLQCQHQQQTSDEQDMADCKDSAPAGTYDSVIDNAAQAVSVGSDGSNQRTPAIGGGVSVGSFSASDFASAALAASHALLPCMSVRDAGLLLWSCGKLQLRPPAAWIATVLQAMQARFLDAELPALALCLTGCANLGYMPSQDWMGGLLLATHRQIAAMTANPLSNKLVMVRVVLELLWGLARLGASPNPKWMKLLLLSVHQQLPLLTPDIVSALLLALARLKCRPSPVFLQSLLDRLGNFEGCSNAELVRLVYAAGALRWQPNRHCCGALIAATAGRLRRMDATSLAILQWSLAVMKATPPISWRCIAVEASIRQLDELDAQCLGMVAWAWGRQMVVQLADRSSSARQVSKQPLPKATQQLLFNQHQAGLHRAKQQNTHQLARALLQRRMHLEQQQRPEQPAAAEVTSTRDSIIQQRWPAGQQAFDTQRLLQAAWDRRGQYTATVLTLLLTGIAMMQLAPKQEWLKGMVLNGSKEKLSVLNGFELQRLVWALARLRFVAPKAWLDQVEVMLDVRVSQQYGSLKYSAAWGLERLRQLARAADGPYSDQ